MVHYFRKRGSKSVRLRGLLGSPEFMRAYEAAIGNAEPIVIGADRAKAGTVAATVGLMLASVPFADLADETRRTRRNLLERFREAHGDKRIASIEKKHVQALIDAKAATPSAARNLLAVIRLLMKFAIEAGIRADDPTIGVKRPKIKTDGYRTWDEDEIAIFEAAHPLGTRARLALALLLGTGSIQQWRRGQSWFPQFDVDRIRANDDARDVTVDHRATTMAPVRLLSRRDSRVLLNHWLAPDRLSSDMASSGLRGSSMMIMSPPRPVRVPPTEVAIRKPRAVSSISVSESFDPIRVPGKADRYQGTSTTARKSLECFFARSPE
jgi:hypothetical protein